MHQSELDYLVLAMQEGNERAFRIVFQLYHSPLLRYAYRICNHQQLAQDAVQNAWMQLARNIRQLDDPRALRAWLYRSVRWQAIDLLRAARRQRDTTEPFENAEQPIDEDAIMDSEALHQAIGRLPPLERQVIHLYYLDELTVDEIAAVAELAPGTVKSRLFRARKLLKERFDV
ncbi:MAG: RNA polymerase sigma factor [Pseudohongiella sp.]|uniref:RNA polymerase sigma factor n=1 Tax=Pseudohongiella sp. TaxID=1979412 RepID=UPI0034A08CCF